MEAVKGNWENRKNEAEFALRRLVAVRNKEPQPSLHVLQRKVEEMKKELEKFGNAQGALLEKGSGRLTDEERTNYVTNYEQVVEKMYDELDIATEMVRLLENPAPAIAPPSVDQSISNEKSSVSRCKGIIDYKLKKLKEKLEDESAVHGVASLSNMQTMLEGVRKVVYEEYAVAYSRLLELDIGNHAANVMERDASIQSMEETIGDIGLTISMKMNAVAPNTSSSATGGGGGSVKSDMYFERRKFPTFDGKRRNFPSFKKEWRTCIQPSFGVEFQLREIVKAVPKDIQPDIKNLKTMEEVWQVLAHEYGRPRELVTECIRGLTNFKFTAKTECEKFVELFRKWTEVIADLEEIGEGDALNHASIVESVVMKFPSSDCRSRYAKFIISPACKDKSNLQLLKEFMLEERGLQRELMKFVEAEKGISGVKCYGCQESGHMSKDCPKNKSKTSRSVNACVKVAPTPCPACDGQHSFQSNGETLYKTYLSACEVFRSMIVAERARIVERARCCQLCLDWTGQHQRESCQAVTKAGQPYGVCTAMDNGIKCGLKHNKMLHGSTIRYCNLNIVHSMARKKTRGQPVDITAVPTEEELQKADLRAGPNTLMQMLYVDFHGPNPSEGVAFFDNGSNIHLIRKEFAEKLGLEGKPCTQLVQTSNREPEQWNTKAYWVSIVDRKGRKHLVFAYEVDQITAPLERVNIKPALEAFPGVREEEILRPTGHVDLLIGIQSASIHPKQVKEAGNLRLLETIFGTGKLIDGCCAGIPADPVYIGKHCYTRKLGIIAALSLIQP